MPVRDERWRCTRVFGQENAGPRYAKLHRGKSVTTSPKKNAHWYKCVIAALVIIPGLPDLLVTSSAQPTGMLTYEVFIQRGARKLICMRAWLYVGAPGHWVVRRARALFGVGKNNVAGGRQMSSGGQRRRPPAASCVSMASLRELKWLIRKTEDAALIVFSLAEEENRSGKIEIRSPGTQERGTVSFESGSLTARLITVALGARGVILSGRARIFFSR